LVLITRKNAVVSERVYSGRIIDLRVDKVESPTGRTVTRETVEHNGGVVIACQPKPNQIILIRQYRYSIDEELVELPAGRIEKDEEPLSAAQRELTEETGYVASEWREIARMYTAPGFCNELLYLYRASDVIFTAKNPDEDEEIEVLELDLRDAWQMVQEGKIRDAKTVAGLGLLVSAQHS
jgi:ADP-ribose pyrophosphatase